MTQKPSRKLPNSPLAEVVFEYRWDLPEIPGSTSNQFVFAPDPFYPFLKKDFIKNIRKNGFIHSVPIAEHGFSARYTVADRFYQGADKKFPILQLGSGLFAANANGNVYEWESYKKLVLDGMKALLDSYPTIVGNKRHVDTPKRLEIRYINFFDAQFLPSSSRDNILEFINNETRAKFMLPELRKKDAVNDFNAGRIILGGETKIPKDSKFLFDLGTITSKDMMKSIRLETKIETVLWKPKRNEDIIKGIEKWLDEARGFLSPFFEDFISQDLMQKLKRPVKTTRSPKKAATKKSKRKS